MDLVNEKLIYTDCCLDRLEKQIALETGCYVVKRMPDDTWNVNDAMSIITNPFVELAVINKIDSISLMEISLLHFMAKPILVTTKSIESYPAVEKAVDHIDVNCCLLSDFNSFISWYKNWKRTR